MNIDNVLSKVRALVERAEHPETPTEEAATCRAKADELMFKYAIDQATLRASQPVAEQMKPSKIKVDLCDAGIPFEQHFCDLVSVVAEHTRCQVLFSAAQMPKDVLRQWADLYGKPLKCQAVVYGFQADLKYFEILYTTLVLHMSNGIDPKPNFSLTDEENAYALHNSGYNWGDIAKMYYRHGHEHGWDGHKIYPPEPYPGKYWKQCYNRYLRKHKDTKPVSLPAKFTDAARLVWRHNFARSYNSSLRRRMWLARSERKGGQEMVLRADMDAIRQMLAEEHPDAQTMKEREKFRYNEEAWGAGNKHAATADLNGSSRVARPSARELS
jgi:hypothetical protein